MPPDTQFTRAHFPGRNAPRMKPNILQTSFALGVLFHLTAANAQLLHYEFTEGVGTTSASSGSVAGSLTLRNATGVPTSSLWGAPGSGPSSSPADRALNLTSAGGMGTGSTGPSAFAGSVGSVAPLTSFTITGWFRPGSEDLARAKFLEIRNTNFELGVTGLSGGPAGARNRLRLTIETNGDSFPEVDVLGDFEAEWSTVDSWAFFAISYNSQSPTEKVKFYSGSISGSSSLSRTTTSAVVLLPLGSSSILIGARKFNEDPFLGFIDDFRIYGDSLSASDIEHVRLQAVPEPGSMALLGLGGLSFVWARRHRR